MNTAEQRVPTDKQARVLAYLIGYIDEHGYSPTAKIIAKDFGWASANSAAVHLQLLHKKGLLRKTPRGFFPA